MDPYVEIITLSWCFFQVEGLIDEIDFKAKVTRAEFEELCADLFERVPHPVQDALTAAEMNLVCIPYGHYVNYFSGSNFKQIFKVYVGTNGAEKKFWSRYSRHKQTQTQCLINLSMKNK